jgi:hypothetical protein
MEPQDQQSEVAAGAVLAALSILDAIGDGDEEALDRAGEIAGHLEAWGVTAITKAFGFLICGALSAVLPEEGEPDRLHTVVPAVLAKLGKIEYARPFLPTMAGVLTAAAVGDDVWQWRMSLGAVGRKEASAWVWTAWLLADLIDTGHGERGRFVRDAARIVANSPGDQDPPAGMPAS